MKRLVIGILAHVDSGKTTLSEALLFGAGEISSLGRVDHKDAFLDTDEIEKDRGITIFSKQAVMNINDTKITLLDTPGHVDFSAETERTLNVLDYAILVISGTDGVQSHTQTLWKMLEHYNVPTFIFINKMDISESDHISLIDNLKEKLSDCCVDFSNRNEDFYENISILDEKLLDEYIQTESIGEKSIKDAILKRKVFPCYFGSALKNDGVLEFLNELSIYTKQKQTGEELGAKVFKIGNDDKGQRLTYMKITSGSLKVKTQLSNQKVNEIRIYSGEKYVSVQEAYQGDVCAVTGLSFAECGEGIGIEKNSDELITEPIFSYNVRLPQDIDVHTALGIFKKLEEEETKLHILWNEYTQQISVELMGEIQLEVLKRILCDRSGLLVEFEHGSVIYKETIKNKVLGVGHYEPLKHYAEVHLMIEPGEKGSGLVFKTKCSEDVLERNWQRLIMTHLEEKTHIGVLCGMPITDVVITLVNGRAHQKHTEGGDFRQATYRAVRQGLRQAESILLEPWYSFEILVPMENTGRAMTDLQRMGASFEAPETVGNMSKICGSAPIKEIREYQKDITLYTHGLGTINCFFKGYEPCANQEQVIKDFNYNCDADIENTADSVFCSHGSGFLVKWNEVFDYMHLEKIEIFKEKELIEPKVRRASEMIADEAELLKIFEHTYGKIQRKSEGIIRTQKEKPEYKVKPIKILPQYLLIDGYNIIFAWDELKEVAKESLEDARILLINKIANYQAMKQNNVIIVFDAYKVKGEHREIENIYGIKVVYTKEAETADSYIEKTTEKLVKNYRVRVATSDNLVQMIIFGTGAERVSAKEFYDEVTKCEEELRELIKDNNKKSP